MCNCTSEVWVEAVVIGNVVEVVVIEGVVEAVVIGMRQSMLCLGVLLWLPRRGCCGCGLVVATD